jgi:hypothetical protein
MESGGNGASKDESKVGVETDCSRLGVAVLSEGADRGLVTWFCVELEMAVVEL